MSNSFLLKEAGVRFVSTVLVSDPGGWPVHIQVHFLDPAGLPYVWDAGSYNYANIPGVERDDGGPDIDAILDDWCVIAGANLAEWVAVRDREEWRNVRPDDTK